MSRTYRRKNGYNKKRYVNDWFVDHEHEHNLNPVNYHDNTLRSEKVRNNWYHSDNFKPIATSGLKFLKELSNYYERAKARENLRKVKFLIDYEDFKGCYDYHYKKNEILYCYF